MDTIIQSWDTTQTRSATSDYVVGQVWGCKGADFYLLDQVRGRMDFDQTVQAIRDLSAKWPDSTAKILEAQTLGAALSSHLKHEISGLIPIAVKGTKAMRALNCVPVWQSQNVYLPPPDNGIYAWVPDYVQELLNFPNGKHDDQVDATTLALNQLRGRLFPESKECVVPADSAKPSLERYYYIAWVPARADDNSTLLVYDVEDNKVVHFERTSAENQITRVFEKSVAFNNAMVRAIDGYDEAMLNDLEVRGVFVDRVKFSTQKLAAAFENLSMLIHNHIISYPRYPELMAELGVFKSDFTYGEAPDYSLQVAQQSGILALCLVTYDVAPEAPSMPIEVYYSYDFDLLRYGGLQRM
jgi:predicted phage terminase large subunit-like protein